MFHPAAALHRQELADTLRQDMLKIPALLADRREPAAKTTEHEREAETEDGPQQLSLF